jgi:hypothetical protein
VNDAVYSMDCQDKVQLDLGAGREGTNSRKPGEGIRVGACWGNNGSFGRAENVEFALIDHDSVLIIVLGHAKQSLCHLETLCHPRVRANVFDVADLFLQVWHHFLGSAEKMSRSNSSKLYDVLQYCIFLTCL